MSIPKTLIPVYKAAPTTKAPTTVAAVPAAKQKVTAEPIEPKPKAHSAPGNVDPRKYWEQWANDEMKTCELKNRQQLFGWFEGNKPKLGKIKQEGVFDLLETIQTTWDKHYSAKEG